MNKVGYALLILGMMSLGAGAADAQAAGDWVLGNYKNAGYWFPGIIAKVGNGKITILYDDGDRETVSNNNVRPYN